MLSKINLVISLLFLRLVLSWDNQRTVEVVSALLTDSNCPGILAIFDSVGGQIEDDELVDIFITKQSKPVTLLESLDGVLLWVKDRDWKTDLVCQNVVVFSRQSTKFTSIYREIKSRFFVNKAVMVAQYSPEEANETLFDIQQENVFVVLEKPGRDLEIYTWKAANRVMKTTIKIDSDVSKQLAAISSTTNLSGRHLIIGLVNNPPAVIVGPSGSILGIEPSLIETMSSHLQFTYNYVQASSAEMWGEVIVSGGNKTITGLFGMLARKEVDAVVGNFYINYVRWPYVSYTVAYKINYESYLVPAPRPYAKWTALFYSFTVPTWLATIGSAIVVIIMLRLAAAWSAKDTVFADFHFCCLYVIGNLSNVQMQPQSIICNANRMFLIWWLFGTLILTTGYRSGLISHMTFPFTPPAIDTIQQLVDSPLKVASFSSYSKDILVNASSQIGRQLGNNLIIHYNLTEMFALLETGSWAVESNLDYLLYIAATMYPTTTTGPKVHLIKETMIPSRVALGLQKGSQLKPYFDNRIQRLIESGIVDYHQTMLAKKLDNWNPKKANERISFSLDSLQGAFYMLGIGVVASVAVFLTELIVIAFNDRRNQSNTANITQSAAEAA